MAAGNRETVLSVNVKFGAIAIGRNEGDRLKRCLQSLSEASIVIYVDSGSNDGSVQYARDLGINVVELDLQIPFTAARARNAGFESLREKAPDLSYVQFVDGDCELREDWHQHALSFLETHADVAIVCGRRRERYPERSVYNWLCDNEWDGPIGEVLACGGDAMMRAIAVDAVGRYRDDLIAGEEPELCVRLRAAGWHIWRLPFEMTLHDAAMTRFAQWWRRAVRAGYAFAEGAYLHGAPPELHWVWEARRAWLWGVWLPFVCLATGIVFGAWGWAAWLIYPLQILRQTVRNRGPVSDRAVLALFQVLARFPEGWGQIKFTWNRLLGRQAHLIEYK
jgi:glycosyltransferase involved in cell wall biosynthesis